MFGGVSVTRSAVLCICFVDRWLSFCTFSFGHCVAYSSSIYVFWLLLWYLQTLHCCSNVYNHMYERQNILNALVFKWFGMFSGTFGRYTFIHTLNLKKPNQNDTVDYDTVPPLNKFRNKAHCSPWLCWHILHKKIPNCTCNLIQYASIFTPHLSDPRIMLPSNIIDFSTHDGKWKFETSHGTKLLLNIIH